MYSFVWVCREKLVSQKYIPRKAVFKLPDRNHLHSLSQALLQRQRKLVLIMAAVLMWTEIGTNPPLLPPTSSWLRLTFLSFPEFGCTSFVQPTAAFEVWGTLFGIHLCCSSGPAARRCVGNEKSVRRVGDGCWSCLCLGLALFLLLVNYLVNLKW